jgi:hypothetical protein
VTRFAGQLLMLVPTSTQTLPTAQMSLTAYERLAGDITAISLVWGHRVTSGLRP